MIFFNKLNDSDVVNYRLFTFQGSSMENPSSIDELSISEFTGSVPLLNIDSSAMIGGIGSEISEDGFRLTEIEAPSEVNPAINNFNDIENIEKVGQDEYFVSFIEDGVSKLQYWDSESTYEYEVSGGDVYHKLEGYGEEVYAASSCRLANYGSTGLNWEYEDCESDLSVATSGNGVFAMIGDYIYDLDEQEVNNNELNIIEDSEITTIDYEGFELIHVTEDIIVLDNGNNLVIYDINQDEEIDNINHGLTNQDDVDTEPIVVNNKLYYTKDYKVTEYDLNNNEDISESYYYTSGEFTVDNQGNLYHIVNNDATALFTTRAEEPDTGLISHPFLVKEEMNVDNKKWQFAAFLGDEVPELAFNGNQLSILDTVEDQTDLVIEDVSQTVSSTRESSLWAVNPTDTSSFGTKELDGSYEINKIEIKTDTYQHSNNNPAFAFRLGEGNTDEGIKEGVIGIGGGDSGDIAEFINEMSFSRDDIEDEYEEESFVDEEVRIIEDINDQVIEFEEPVVVEEEDKLGFAFAILSAEPGGSVINPYPERSGEQINVESIEIHGDPIIE